MIKLVLGGLLPIVSETRSGFMNYVYWKTFFNCKILNNTSIESPTNLGGLLGLIMINPIGVSKHYYMFFVSNSEIELIRKSQLIVPFTLSFDDSKNVIYTPSSENAGMVIIWSMKST